MERKRAAVTPSHTKPLRVLLLFDQGMVAVVGEAKRAKDSPPDILWYMINPTPHKMISVSLFQSLYVFAQARLDTTKSPDQTF
jgi:hypothetical protein